jgi:hypothetical protein
MATTILRQFEDLTPTVLTALLRDAGTLGAGAVTALTIEPIGAGVGFLGQVARLRPRYDPTGEAGPSIPSHSGVATGVGAWRMGA